ncbi:MAG: TIR domain-containing protein [Rhizobiales bacterium]|nr:TIR domain-containing protein [Hyphomicrobiales bacterium]
MARIFLSYSRAQRATIEELAALLEANGHEVWWDAELISGEPFRTVIDREINRADVAIVVWTPDSINSNWVIAEADHAERQAKLLPLRTAEVEPWQIPKPYGTLHAELVGNEDRVLAAVAAAAARVVSGAPAGEAQESAGGTVVGRQDQRHVATKYAPTTQPAAEKMTTVLIAAAVLLGTSAVAGGYWHRDGSADKAWLAIPGGAVASVVLGSILFGLAAQTRQPLYRALAAYLIVNIMLFAWPAVALVAAFGDGLADGSFLARYPRTLAICAAGVLGFTALLLAQRRGVASVLTIAQLVAGALAAILGVASYRQILRSGAEPTWLTTHVEALNHLLTIAAGLAGAALAIMFLVASVLLASRRPAPRL